MTNQGLLTWKEEYSVGVVEIDEQHKALFKTINELVFEIDSLPDKKKVEQLVSEIEKYKFDHFATEERYFEEFGYSERDMHIKAHRQFNEVFDAMKVKYGEDYVGLAFVLTDFLEDWLITHLLSVDRRYIECFKSHGLK
jgi:hemerythrin